MEELHGSEKMDQEILADARKRAADYLSDAEKQIRQLTAEHELAIEREASSLQAEHQARLRKAEADSLRSVPLEYRRRQLRHESDAVQTALLDWLAGLSDQDLIRLLEPGLRLSLPFWQGNQIDITLCALARGEFDTLLRPAFAGTPIHQLSEIALPRGDALARGLSLTTLDGATSYQASCRELAEELLETHSASLQAALFPLEPAP